MAIIPPDQKFHTLDASTPTDERGSIRTNSMHQIFTMQDIIDSVSGGGGSFTELTDTPSSYAGAAGQFAAVNSGETGLEFVDVDTSAISGQIVSYTLRDVPFNGFSDGEYEGKTIDLGNNFGGTQQAGLIYYWTGTQWDLASNAAVSSASPLIGVLTNKLTNGNLQTVLLSGVVRMKALPTGVTTNNEVLYLSTAGGTTVTPPGTGTTMRVVGRSFSASNPNRIYFNPSADFFEL